MPKLTIEDLVRIKEKHKETFTLKEGGYRVKITVHMGTCGIAVGAESVLRVIQDEVFNAKAKDIRVTKSGCAGLCAREPIVTVEILNQPPIKYCDVDATKMKEIFQQHIMGGNPVERYALVIGKETIY